MVDVPNGNGFKMKVAERWGNMFTALENLKERQKECDGKLEALDDKLDTMRGELKDFFQEKCTACTNATIKEVGTLKTKLNKLYTKVVAVGVGVGIIVSFIFGVLQDLITKALGG